MTPALLTNTNAEKASLVGYEALADRCVTPQAKVSRGSQNWGLNRFKLGRASTPVS